jgi:acyl transferase domain-containing protein/thioesterase domain-containing protein
MSVPGPQLDGIAVIGYSGRFPGARNVEEFWHNLRNGVESIRRFSDDELKALGIGKELYGHPHYVKAGSVIEGLDLFDAEFFGYSPREAQLTDPQQRIFLECAWEALEQTGCDPERYEGLIGVFAGCGPNRYLNGLAQNPDPSRITEAFQVDIGNEKDYIATRVAYKLNLRGPSLTVQTACSTSLVAVHLACQNLLTYQCDMALAGGVTLNPRQRGGYFHEEGMIPSPDGHCRAFDAKANGTVIGEGAGIVVLKRYSEAVADGDSIHAIIRGSAINNDGSLKVGFTAPSVTGQADVIAMAQGLSDVTADRISYVETHGTGTPLGDPIEIAALTQAFRKTTDRKGYCAIGSVKTNMGHLDAAAGVTGLLKTVLMLEHRKIVPSLHFETPNPNIDFESSPFYVNTQLREWESNGLPRVAGVSSFGIGGTNAHVILEEPPAVQQAGEAHSWQLLPISARSEKALKHMAANLAEHLEKHSDIPIADAAFTLQSGRREFSHRSFAVCRNPAEAVEKLRRPLPRGSASREERAGRNGLAFLFSGQGSQYAGMGWGLYQAEPLYRAEIDRCCDIIHPWLSSDLRELLYAAGKDTGEAGRQITLTQNAQAALFVTEYALAKLAMARGCEPSALAGHSIGEYVAACVAGVFRLEDALATVAIRGKLMGSLPPGAMLAVFLPEERLKTYIGSGLSIAVINSPGLCVVSGTLEAVEKLQARLSCEGVDSRLLHTSHAFHSEMTDPICDVFARHMKTLNLSRPAIPMLSNVTGTWIRAEEASDPLYWVRHLRHPVRFSDCLGELFRDPGRILLEIGPSRMLSTLALQHPGKPPQQPAISLMRHPSESKDDVECFLEAFGQLWSAGFSPDWSRLRGEGPRQRVPLPTYPFERKRHWLGGTGAIAEVAQGRAAVAAAAEAARAPAVKSPVQPDTVEILTGIWKDLFGYDRIGEHESFFELGGSSLLALMLTARIEKNFHRRLPLSVLYEAPTIAALAEILSSEKRQERYSSVVAIRAGGTRPPLFLVHGAGGNVMIYNDLARRLGEDQPVYGLQARGLDGAEPPVETVEEMAALYLSEIERVQGEGPYLLGGYCLGGTIAFEMARQLIRKGKNVALLALLETYNFSKIADFSLPVRVGWYLQKIEYHWANFMLLNREEKKEFLREKLKVVRARTDVWSGMVTQLFGPAALRRRNGDSTLYEVWKANDRAAFQYVPGTYPGRVVQFCPLEEYRIHRGPKLGWEGIATNGLQVYRLPVYPAGMLVEPFVKRLAGELRIRIDEALEADRLRIAETRRAEWKIPAPAEEAMSVDRAGVHLVTAGGSAG